MVTHNINLAKKCDRIIKLIDGQIKKMTFLKNFQFLVKELNKNKSQITKVFFTIFISLLIFSSTIILKNSIKNEIKKTIPKSFLGVI